MVGVKGLGVVGVKGFANQSVTVLLVRIAGFHVA